MNKHLIPLIALVLFGGCATPCENDISQSAISPSGALKVVVFNRGCGATVGFNTQISILPSGTRLPDDGGNTLSMEGFVPLKIRWESNSTVIISGVSSARILKQETSVHDVRVVYVR